MNREEFLEKMKDLMQTEEDITCETVLENILEWDSLAKMSTLAFLDNDFGVKLTFNDFSEIKTIEDIAKKAGIL